MPAHYRTEIYDGERSRWVAISGDTETVAAAKRQYELTAAARKRILRLALDGKGKTRIDVILDSNAEVTHELEPVAAPTRMIDRLVYEPDGNVLSARSRRQA